MERAARSEADMAAPTAGVARKAKAATAAVEMAVKYILLWMVSEDRSLESCLKWLFEVVVVKMCLMLMVVMGKKGNTGLLYRFLGLLQSQPIDGR